MSRIRRRDLITSLGVGIWGASASRWFPAFAEEVASDPARRRQAILLWMPGGPSQTDTFDMKPGHANGGEFEEIATSVPGLRFSEHLPRLATHAEHLAIVRSLSTKEGDHERGTQLVRTGFAANGPVAYPALGASLGKALGEESAELPNYVSIAPIEAISPAAFGPGFLGPSYAPLKVAPSREFDAAADPDGFAELGVSDLTGPGTMRAARAEARLGLWTSLEEGFLAKHRAPASEAHATVYRRATRMMQSEAAQAFELSDEPDAVRGAYGRGTFGQGCLMARRLIERGVPMVEVALSGGGPLGWDTHQNNFATVRRLSGELDAGFSSLLGDLADRGLLETTTILWMGEFGRTPRINNMGGRDHFPAAWTTVMAGGGIQGGSIHGRTSDDGTTIVEDPVEIADLLATFCGALGVDPELRNISPLGRPIRIAEGTPIAELLRG